MMPTLTLPATLSARGREVAGLYTKGYSAKFVAARLGISVRTLETHVRHVYEKMGVGMNSPNSSKSRDA